jgi:hypothetical protein
MSVILRPRTTVPSGHRISTKAQGGRNLATLMTLGAALVALVLAATIPASAGPTAKAGLRADPAASLMAQD